jgi:hypothetical protein
LSEFGIPVIGLSGPAGSGKSTAAAALLKTPGYIRLPLAGPIKRMLRAGLGLTEEHTDGALKEVPVEKLGGFTPRRLLQTLGTDWGRSMDPEFWLRIWLNDALQASWSARGIVVDDVRFLNEASFLRRETGARIISIVTPHESPLGSVEAAHASERELGAIVSIADDIIVNRKANIPEFQQEILRAVGLI